jgi:hypothetical protein
MSDVLARDDAALAALRAAVRANLAHRDPAVERALVEQRIDAFGAVTWPEGRADWPPAYYDPFPGLEGLPVVAAGALTADILAGAILHHGAVWVKGLADRQDVTRLREGIDAACAARSRYHAGAALEGDVAWYAPLPEPKANAMQRQWVEKDDCVLTMDSPRMAFDLIEFFDRNGLIGMIAAFLGERPALSVMKSTLRRVNPDTGTDWHQDGAFLGAHVRSVNVWLALSPCGVDAAGLELVGRRVPYVLQTGSHGSIFDWAVGPGVVEMLAQGGAPVLNPVFEAGDALLFDHLMLHRTGIRPGMTQSRWAVESWFFAPSRYPADQVAVVV